MVFSSLAVLLAGMSLGINVTTTTGTTTNTTHTDLVPTQYFTLSDDNTLRLSSGIRLDTYANSIDTTEIELKCEYTLTEGTTSTTYLLFNISGSVDTYNNKLVYSLYSGWGELNFFYRNFRVEIDNSYNANTYYDPLYYDEFSDGLGELNLDDYDLYNTRFVFANLYIERIPENIYQGMTQGNQDAGYSSGYNQGHTDGYNQGFEEGKTIGYDNGFNVAKGLYEDADSTITSIFDGILSVGLIPLEFFMSIFNFEILGINITSIIGAILSIMVIVILLRILLGSKASGK